MHAVLRAAHTFHTHIRMREFSSVLGVIPPLPPPALSMFGYSALELRGTNVSAIIPEPFASAHNGYITKYMQTGQGVRVCAHGGVRAV